MSDYRDRIARLSQASRQRLSDALADHLREKSGASSTALVAYVVAAPDQHPQSSELREHVRRSLPEYMIPSSFVFLEAMPRLPNGKVAVDELPDASATVAADESGLVAPQTEVEKTLVDIWSSVLGVGEIGVHDNFFEIGGDSILSIRIVALAREAGLSITPDLLFDHQTVASLARVVEDASQSAEASPSAPVDEDTAGVFPLTPIQHWFFEQQLAAPNHWNQSLMLRSGSAVRFDRMQKAVDAVAQAHAMLRARFVTVDDRFTCRIADERISVEQVDLTSTPDADRDAVISARVSTAEASLDIEHGPVVRVTMFDNGPDEVTQVHIAAHHLVVDVLSWQKIVADLSSAYAQAGRDEPIVLTAPSAAFVAWSRHLVSRAAAPELRNQLAYWIGDGGRDGSGDDGDALLPVDHTGQRFTEATAAFVEVVLPDDTTTALLTKVPGVYGTQIDEVLLAALATTIGRWVGNDRVLVGLERHGRETTGYDLDVSETVGWFTSYFPVTIKAHPNATASDPGGLLKSVKEQLRAVPEKGLPFGIGRYLAPDDATRSAMQSVPDPPIIFNYAGRLASPDSEGGDAFVPVGGFLTSRSPLNHRRHQLEINAFVDEGRLVVRWQYSTAMFADSTVEQLARAMRADLEALIEHCQTEGAGGYTPSDFPDIDLGQDDLDHLLGSL